MPDAQRGLLTAGPEKDALVMRALSELRRAQSLGDNSELVQITLDRIRNVPITPAFQAPKTADGREDGDCGNRVH